MTKSYQKALLLGIRKYSLFNSLLDILKNLADETKGFDVRETIKVIDQNLHTQIYRFPYKIRSYWENYFLTKINKNIINEVFKYKPDLILIYNSEFLLPNTCIEIKKKAKLIFFMGDSPFFTHTNNYYLPCLEYADLILSSDSFWLSQLNTIGLKKTMFFIPGMNLNAYFKVSEPSLNDEKETDILYVGSSYKNSWGYKKAKLMNNFVNFNLKIYGNDAWKRWFDFFPKLKNKFQKTTYIPTKKLNKMFNKSKIIPINSNPTIFNGIHLRLVEALSAGTLPLIEYRNDVDKKIFAGLDITLPLIDNYNEAEKVAKYWLTHENERLKTIEIMRSYFLEKYSPEKNAYRIKEKLNV